MLGYLNYALDHPQLFKYMFSTHRDGAFVFPRDLEGNKLPTFNVLQTVVSELMDRRVLQSDDVAQTALSIWAHAHGLSTLYLCGRITSLDRLLHGLAERTGNKS